MNRICLQNFQIRIGKVLLECLEIDFVKSNPVKKTKYGKKKRGESVFYSEKDEADEKAVLNTVHAYTATQGLVDGPAKKDFTRGRAAAINMAPSHTGAALAAAKVVPELQGKFDGVAVRVPVACGSLADFTFLAKRKITVEEINEILTEASGKKEWRGILKVSKEPLVSTDIVGEPYGAIVDLSFTRVIDGDLVKVFSWYDNEWGYCNMLIKHIKEFEI